MNVASNTDRKPWETMDDDLENFVSVASAEEHIAIDDALQLHPVSIRLQKGLLNDLKQIADFYQVGYQPLVRDLLNRFVKAEKQFVLSKLIEQHKRELQAHVEASQDSEPSFEAVDNFLEHERQRRFA